MVDVDPEAFRLLQEADWVRDPTVCGFRRRPRVREERSPTNGVSVSCLARMLSRMRNWSDTG